MTVFFTSKKQNPISVGLVGDGDEIDLLEDFESIFQISFSDKEAEGILDLGDANKLICSKLPADREKQMKCLTAMAFYRLNRATRNVGKTSPKTSFVVPESLTPKKFQKQLESESDLKLDFLTRPSSWVSALAVLQFVSWIAALFIFSEFSTVLAIILIIGITHCIWRLADKSDGRVWQFAGTVEDLCKQAVETNFGKLVLLGGRWSEADVWNCMTSIIQSHTGFPASKMEPNLKFI